MSAYSSYIWQNLEKYKWNLIRFRYILIFFYYSIWNFESINMNRYVKCDRFENQDYYSTIYNKCKLTK